MNQGSIVDDNCTEEGEVLDEEDAHDVVIVQESSSTKRDSLLSDDDPPRPRERNRRRLGPVKAIQFEVTGLNMESRFEELTSTSLPYEMEYARSLYTSFTSDDVLDHVHEQVESLQRENSQLRHWNSELMRIRDYHISVIQRLKAHHAEEVQFLESENQRQAALLARDSVFAEQAIREVAVLRVQNNNLQNEKNKLEAELKHERKNENEAASLKEKLSAEQSRAIAMEVEVQVREQQVDELKQKLSKAYEQLRRYKLAHDFVSSREFADTFASGPINTHQEAEPTTLQDDDVIDVKPDIRFI